MKTVVVVGVGALGSHFVQLGRNLDVSWVICDYDRVERANALSQFYGKASVGKTKVNALAQVMQFLWNLKLQTIPHKLVEDNASQILGRADLVVDCLDNGEARRIVQGYVREHGIPCLHGGLAADGTFGLALWDEDFQVDDEPSEGAATCEDGEHLPFISIVASYMARSVQEFLTSERKVGFQISPSGAMRV